jgi:hypothetical protein
MCFEQTPGIETRSHAIEMKRYVQSADMPLSLFEDSDAHLSGRIIILYKAYWKAEQVMI